MSAKDWENYLWRLLPRPYKASGEDAVTEARKSVQAGAEEYARLQDAILGARNNWLIDLMPGELLGVAGYERGRMFRWPKETDEEYRLRLHNAFLWYAMGGTPGGLKIILEALGYRNVKITERVTEEQWAEFAVEVTLASGDLLVQDQIDRVVRIVNEVKAAHTKLVSTNVIYDPPDIGLDPDHMHRYDYCYYDLGLWPRPTEHWNFTEHGRVLIRGALHRRHYDRMLVWLGPTYDASLYDALYFGKWLRLHRRLYRGHTIRGRRYFYRTWNDPGTWDDPAGKIWNERYFQDVEEPNRAGILTIPRSAAVYGWSRYDDLNSFLGGGYCNALANAGNFDEATYDADGGATGTVPICRYYVRYIPSKIKISEDGKVRAWNIRAHFLRSSITASTVSAPALRETRHFSAAKAYDGYDTWETRGGWTGTWDERDEQRWRTRKIMVTREVM